MLISLILFLLIAFGGMFLTYLYEKDDSLLARFCAGNIVGAAFWGTLTFVLACSFGLNVWTILVSLLITISPLILLTKNNFRAKFLTDFGNAKANLSGVNVSKSLSFVYYFALILLLYFFFERAMIETSEGIFTGASQNLGDLPFHLGAIFSFTDGNNFPPQNPSFANAKFTYPFIADFTTACFVKIGASVRDAMLVQNVVFGFSLVVLFEKFTFAITKNRLAGKLAPLILLFCGGLGFGIFLRDFSNDGRGLFEYLWNLTADYTIRPKGIRWGNSLTTLFITQRGLLLGLPLTLIVLNYLWKIFNAKDSSGDGVDEENSKRVGINSVYELPLSMFIIGLLAGTLPLIHVHSLVVLFVVSAFLFFFKLSKWREWLIFGVSCCVIAVPELIWSLTGSASRLNEFVGWHFGWVAEQENIFVFWLKNLGVFLPLLVLGLLFIFIRKKEAGQSDEDATKIPNPIAQILFYLPFVAIFIIANLFKLAPWEWDNIKVLIYWFVASIPFVALVVANLWERKSVFRIIAVSCLFVLTLSGALDIWRVVSKQINYNVFSKDAVAIAEQIKQKTPPNALFLNAPTYNSAVVLSGRRSLMRYSGHLGSYGIDYTPREDEVKRIYEGSGLAESLLKKNGIEYVIISPEENDLMISPQFFEKYPKIAEVGMYRVYKIK